MKLKILTVPFLSALLTITASAQYKRTDLDSNQPGVAPTTDQHLVNGWGLTALPASPSGSATIAPDSPPSILELASKFHCS
jgi:hypothetical protein